MTCTTRFHMGIEHLKDLFGIQICDCEQQCPDVARRADLYQPVLCRTAQRCARPSGDQAKLLGPALGLAEYLPRNPRHTAARNSLHELCFFFQALFQTNPPFNVARATTIPTVLWELRADCCPIVAQASLLCSLKCEVVMFQPYGLRPGSPPSHGRTLRAFKQQAVLKSIASES